MPPLAFCPELPAEGWEAAFIDETDL